MIEFLKKLSLCLAGLAISYIILYTSVHLYYNHLSNEKTLFIWGDSQIYQGLDLEVLAKESNKVVYTAARHGAGVYDFMVFAETVPKNSQVLVAISKPVQLRLKEYDRNRSGLHLPSLNQLYNHNYSLKQILNIISKNTKPVNLFATKTEMYPNTDSVVIKELNFIKEAYKAKPTFLVDKQNLYEHGVNRLREKNCKIHLIEFPFHSLIQDIVTNPEIQIPLDIFFRQIRNSINCNKIDSLYLDSSSNNMFDLTHLNGNGAKQTSKFIGKKIKEDAEGQSFLILHTVSEINASIK